jgi:hypothetical protein
MTRLPALNQGAERDYNQERSENYGVTERQHARSNLGVA